MGLDINQSLNGLINTIHSPYNIKCSIDIDMDSEFMLIF